MYDDKHRLVNLSLQNYRSKFVQSGLHEADILCAKCDNEVINQYETYAKTVFCDEVIPPVQVNYFRKEDGLEYTVINGLDYTKFKLFCLSLLWRASISNLPFFAKVKLGKYEEAIREMLNSGNAGELGSFPCMLSRYHNQNLPSEIVGEPREIRVPSAGVKYQNIGYVLVIGGWVFIYNITNKNTDEVFGETVITKEGRIMIPHIPYDQGVKILNHLFNKKIFI